MHKVALVRGAAYLGTEAALARGLSLWWLQQRCRLKPMQNLRIVDESCIIFRRSRIHKEFAWWIYLYSNRDHGSNTEGPFLIETARRGGTIRCVGVQSTFPVP
jgi:hypothetical protein